MDSLYIVIFALLVLVIIPGMLRRRRLAAVRHILNKNKKQQQRQQREVGTMKELAKQFIGRECIIYTVMSNDSSIRGTVKEVTDGGIIVENKEGTEAVNLEYITRIREWPRNSKGKKKQIFG